jgi:hypothetical protein
MEHPAIRLPEGAARHQAIHRLRPAGCPHRRQHDARRHDGVLIGGGRVAAPHYPSAELNVSPSASRPAPGTKQNSSRMRQGLR